MLTVILVAAAAVLVLGLIWLVMQSGAAGKREGKAGASKVTQQHTQPKPPRAQSSSSGAAND